MDSQDRLRLLEALHSGQLSRNRNFSHFDRPDVRAALGGYRRIRSIAREVRREGVEVTCEPVGGSGFRLVQVRNARLGYRRATLLAPWEYDFLTGPMGARLRSPRPPPTPSP